MESPKMFLKRKANSIYCPCMGYYWGLGTIHEQVLEHIPALFHGIRKPLADFRLPNAVFF